MTSQRLAQCHHDHVHQHGQTTLTSGKIQHLFNCLWILDTFTTFKRIIKRSKSWSKDWKARGGPFKKVSRVLTPKKRTKKVPRKILSFSWCLNKLVKIFCIWQQIVLDTLMWMKEHNPKYYDCIRIDFNIAMELPENGIPLELLCIICWDKGMTKLAKHYHIW